MMIFLIMYIMCLIIFEEKAEVQDQYHLSLNPVQKVIKMYIIKIQSQNLIHNNRLLAVPKMSFQMIPKNKDP